MSEAETTIQENHPGCCWKTDPAPLQVFHFERERVAEKLHAVSAANASGVTAGFIYLFAAFPLYHAAAEVSLSLRL